MLVLFKNVDLLQFHVPCLEQVQSAAGVTPVDQVFLLVRKLTGRPADVFDPYALIGALENP